MKFFRYLAINTTLVAVFVGLIYAATQTYTYPRAERPAPVGSPTWVLENNECEAPVQSADVYPTGVILQRMSGDHGSFMSHNPVKVGKALDEVLASKDWAGIRVIQFCK